MIDTFFACDLKKEVSDRGKSDGKGEAQTEWPELRAISLRFEKTNDTVKGFGLNSVF